MSNEVWSEQDEAVYKPLRKKRLRIDAKKRRDKNRQRPYSPRLCSSNDNDSKKTSVANVQLGADASL